MHLTGFYVFQPTQHNPQSKIQAEQSRDISKHDFNS